MRKTHLIVLLVLILLVAAGLVASVVLIRALPGRYAYFLPEPLQRLRYRPHPDTLPTPAISAAPWTPFPTPLPSSPTPSPTWTPTPPATPAPTETPTPSPSPNPTPPAWVVLTGMRYEHQGWNNCGPTTLAIALSYWGRTEAQSNLAPILKPDPEDKHVGISEMQAYVQSIGLGALVRMNGTVEQLKELIRVGFPVIVASWHVRDPGDQLGHYRLVIGYDETASEFILHDSLEGPENPIGYQELDELWRVYNRLYLVVYAQDSWERLAAVIGSDLDDAGMYERALERAQFEVANQPDACVAYAKCEDWVTFSWFNVGTSLTSLGRHAEAAAAYDQARQMGLPYRILWYQFGPYESYYAVGRYDDVIALADATLATAKNLEESYYWRALARQAKGDLDGARTDLGAALRYHEDWPPAAAALAGLPD